MFLEREDVYLRNGLKNLFFRLRKLNNALLNYSETYLETFSINKNPISINAS